MRSSTALVLLLASVPSALGDVLFTSPAAGASVAGGTIVTVSWKDSGDAPALADLVSYQLFLYSGSNEVPQQLVALAVDTPTFTAGSSVKVTIPVGAGGTGSNVYFLGMMSTATVGGIITNFSNRFSLTGMTGTFPAAVIASNKNIAGTTGPDTINAIANQAAAGTIDEGAWGTPYDEQVGPTRYAPMQPIPKTKITATNTDPLWPTSSVPIATTFLPPLGTKIVTTQTQAQTFSAASHHNTVAAQSRPTDDMGRWLARWKD